MYQNYSSGGYGSTPYGPPSFSSQSNYYNNQSSSYGSRPAEGGSGGNVMSRCNEDMERTASALLQHLEKEELQHLHDNDSKLQDLIDDLPQVRSIKQERDDLLATNKSLAEYNLSLQPKLEEMKQVVALDYERINTLKTNLAQDKTRLDGYVGRRSLDTLLALLQTETAKSEEESEDLATNFFDNGMDMEEFLNQYLPRRTEAHLRRIKSERMADLIRENQYSGLGGSSSSAPAVSQPPMDTPPYPRSHGSGHAPYPTSAAFGMPQPGAYHH